MTHRHRRGIRVTSALVGTVTLSVLSLLLRERQCEAQDNHAASRSIGDTTFLLPALADGAFVLTELGLRQGVTYERIRSFPVGSSAQFPLAWSELDEQIEFAVRVTDWLGIYAQGEGTGTVGLDMPSLVFAGGGYAYSGRLGVAVRVLRSERTRSQLTFRAYAAPSGGRTLDLLGLFSAVSVREGRDLEQIVSETHNLSQLPQLVQNELLSLANTNYTNVVLTRTSSWTGGASMHFAQAIVGPLTLQTALGFERATGKEAPFDPTLQDYVSLSSRDYNVLFDSALSSDFSRWHVPVGVSLEYAAEKTFRTVAGVTAYVPSSQDLGGGLFYAGRRGLEVGALLFTNRNLKPLPGYDTSAMSTKPIAYFGAFVLRALW